MVDATPLLPGLSWVQGKAVAARFDGCGLASGGGLLVVLEVERRLDLPIAWPPVSKTRGHRRRSGTAWRRFIRFRMLMIAAGCEDDNDADRLRRDPMFKLALDRLPSD